MEGHLTLEMQMHLGVVWDVWLGRYFNIHMSEDVKHGGVR